MEKARAMKILFVCTGNTCRSSMAEAVARSLAEELGLTHLQFLSAGTSAWPGEKASAQAVLALAEKDIDLSHHRSTPLTPELVEQADLILTMTENHRQQILNQLPFVENKVFTLGTYAGVPGDISDPYGSSVDVYRGCAQDLRERIAKVLEKLQQER